MSYFMCFGNYFWKQDITDRNKVKGKYCTNHNNDTRHPCYNALIHALFRSMTYSAANALAHAEVTHAGGEGETITIE